MYLFHWATLVPITYHIGNEVRHVTSSQRNMLYAAINHEPIYNRYYMGYSVSRIEDCPSIADALVDS
jgi:hypothetical protein